MVILPHRALTKKKYRKKQRLPPSDEICTTRVPTVVELSHRGPRSGRRRSLDSNLGTAGMSRSPNPRSSMDVRTLFVNPCRRGPGLEATSPSGPQGARAAAAVVGPTHVLSSLVRHSPGKRPLTPPVSPQIRHGLPGKCIASRQIDQAASDHQHDPERQMAPFGTAPTVNPEARRFRDRGGQK